MTNRIIIVTGKAGSGKSTVASLFQKHGFTPIVADKIGHTLLRTPHLQLRIAAAFKGEDILSKGKISRKKLGSIVFSNRKKLQILNKIIHPVLALEIKKRLKRGKKYVIDAALFYELGLHTIPALVIVVKAPSHLRFKRLVKKGIKRSVAKKLVMLQKTPKHAAFVINNISLKKTKAQFEVISQKILKA